MYFEKSIRGMLEMFIVFYYISLKQSYSSAMFFLAKFDFEVNLLRRTLQK
jgi:hypothetical protein